MSEQQHDDIPDDLDEMPVTTEDEVDEPEGDDPDADRALEDGVGFHDEGATEMDTLEPDWSDPHADDEIEGQE